MFVERFFSSVRVKALALMLYFVFLLLFLAPGVIAGSLLSMLAGSAALANVLLFAGIGAGSLIVAVLSLFSSRNLLVFAELNQAK